MAYPYIKPGALKLLKSRQNDIRFVVDSGAFTAWKAGSAIKLDDYCRFLETLPITPWRYFSLDVVGDPKGTLENYDAMVKRGFKPIPIFTRGEDPSVLDHYYKTSDVVGIGGLVGTPGNKGFVKGIMRRVGARRVHWLGFTNLEFLKAYRPYMADSSSWEMGARFGVAPLYLGSGLPLVSLKKSTIVKQLKTPRIVSAITRLGLNPNDFLESKNWDGGYSVSRRLGAYSMRHLSEDVGKRLGVNLFLAAATDYAAGLLLGDQTRVWRS